jgi:hypothetical protein
MFLFGLLLVWSKIRDEVWGPIPGADRVTWYGLAFGACAMLGAPWAIVGLIRALRARRRLVVGADRIQLVEFVGNDDGVVLQIPYNRAGARSADIFVLPSGMRAGPARLRARLLMPLRNGEMGKNHVSFNLTLIRSRADLVHEQVLSRSGRL